MTFLIPVLQIRKLRLRGREIPQQIWGRARLQIRAEIGSRSYLIKAKPLFLGIGLLVLLIDPIDSLLLWEPIFPSLTYFSSLWWNSCFCMAAFSFSKASSTLSLQRPFRLTVAKTFCSHNRACLDSFSGKVHEMEFLFLKSNALFSVAFSSRFA